MMISFEQTARVPLRKMCFFGVATIAVVLASAYPVERVIGEEPVRPLSNAHAHNDYEHLRPLLDALDQGFTSIEADLFLVKGELLVAHDMKDTAPNRTLKALYLEPLYDRFQRNGGSIYPGGGNVTLLVDIKSEGAATYSELHRQLAPYSKMISETVGGQHVERAVTVIVSGNRPIPEIKASNPRYVGIDGRLSDLDSDLSSSLMPLISDNWRLHFRYQGKEPITEAEQTKLREITIKAHEKGRRIRFWATPESEQLWQELKSASVDLIGTDDLPRLSKFLRSR